VLKAKLVELRTSQKTNTKATTAVSENNNNNVKVERQVSSQKVRVIAAAAVDYLDCAALRRAQLADNDVGQILQEVEAGQCPEWKDIADYGPMQKSFWAQSNFLVVRDGVLQQHWESANGRTKTAEVVLHRAR
jgi:hypothetical protein